MGYPNNRGVGMRLIKTKSRTVGTKEYHKLRVVVNVNAEDATSLGWEEGEELEAVTRKDGILIRAARGK